MKKFVVLMLISVIVMGLLFAGGNKETSKGSLKVIATIFPEYDWVREILGSNPAGVDVKLLLDNGVDLHSYQPSTDDIVAISTCDLFIYVGGESDEWVDEVLEEAVNSDMKVVNLMAVLGDLAKEEELKEGMQESEHEHDHDHEHEHEHEHEEGEVEYDEHVWLSLRNAKILCTEIASALQSLDPANAATYKSNLDAYVAKLDALDASYSSVVSSSSFKTLLFGDRFPFRYMVDDYSLDYYAAFISCSAETEASFETIAFLVDKVNSLGLKSVMTIDRSDKKIAQTIVSNSNSKDQQILTMNSLQSVTAEDVKGGITYLGVMENNLEVLKQALN